MKKGFKSVCLIALLLSGLVIQSWMSADDTQGEFYQLSIYHFNNTTQETVLDNYLKNALVPALHKLGMKNIGVFKNHSNDTASDKTLYLLSPVQSTEELIKIRAKLNADKDYQTAGAEYINAAFTSPPYARMETILLQAFSLAPKLQVPALKEPRRNRIYELRSYESATEKIFQNKVKMFNEGDEIGLFKRLNFNAAFYGEVIAGGKMPNLMYMTCHENKTLRDANWKAFVDDPFWKKLSAMPEYQHNVSHIDITFLYPAEYSDY